MSRFYYIGFATPSSYGCSIGKYPGEFDFADAQATLDVEHPDGAVIVSVHEISQDQFLKIGMYLKSDKKTKNEKLKLITNDTDGEVH